MPFVNFENWHFSAAEVTAVQDALAALEAALAPKLVDLGPGERQQYGSINELNKLMDAYLAKTKIQTLLHSK